MMRATVYIVNAEGVPVWRRVLQHPVSERFDFEVRASREVRELQAASAAPAGLVECGPIGEPWRRL